MTVGDGFYNLFKGYTWLRSGARNPSDNARYLSSYSAYYYTFPARRFSVRPATHKAVGLFYCHPEARRKERSDGIAIVTHSVNRVRI